MNIIGIIKNAFVFPSKNMKSLGIFIILSLVTGILTLVGVATSILGHLGSGDLIVLGGICLIVSGLVELVKSGYQISIIKSGINFDNSAPNFVWWDNFNTGFDNLIVSIVYFVIPAFIVLIVGYITNIYGKILMVAQECFVQLFNVLIMGASTDLAINSISGSLLSLVISLSITITVALILFVIFSFFQIMAEARLANTGDLKEALNIFEAAKDISRIGVKKVIAVIILVILITAIINSILTVIFSYVPILAILSIIVTPYLLFFTKRAVGLLYSDIA